jgi:RNA polymerase sigma-70 factor (ECF subfamily)
VQPPDIRKRAVLAASAETEGAVPREQRSPSAVPLQPLPAQVERFHALYREHFDFVFRNLRRLGVAGAQIDDALQDVFLVVLRHFDKYQDGSYGKAWLFAIALRVARNYRRSERRRDSHLSALSPDGEHASNEHNPFERAAQAQAARMLHAFLERIDEDKRSVFVMTELEQMSAPEIAAALRLNVNTVYARIRAARREFARAVATASDRRENTDGAA